MSFLFIFGCSDDSATGSSEKGGDVSLDTSDASASVSDSSNFVDASCFSLKDCTEGRCDFPIAGEEGRCVPCPVCEEGSSCNISTRMCEQICETGDCPLGQLCQDGWCTDGCSTELEGCCYETDTDNLSDDAGISDVEDVEVDNDLSSIPLCSESQFACVQDGAYCVVLDTCSSDNECPQGYSCDSGQCSRLVREDVPDEMPDTGIAEDTSQNNCYCGNRSCDNDEACVACNVNSDCEDSRCHQCKNGICQNKNNPPPRCGD